MIVKIDLLLAIDFSKMIFVLKKEKTIEPIARV